MYTNQKMARRWLTAGVVAATLAAPAAAQNDPLKFRVLGSPQSSASPLTTSATTGYSSPPLQSNGLAAKYMSWGGYQWSNDSGQTWNLNVPYAVGTAPTKVRFEIHDTTNDHGQNDPSSKRRSEISSTKEQFHNHIAYWMAFSFKVHWDCLACQRSLKQGGEIMQVHWPSGASPPLAFRVVPYGTGSGFSITTRGDGQSNITRYTGPLTLDTVHDVVFHFELGAVGLEDVWLDGKLLSSLRNIPVGTDLEDGYAMRLGPYYGGGLAGNHVIQEYGNIAAFPSAAYLTSRITNPPGW